MSYVFHNPDLWVQVILEALVLIVFRECQVVQSSKLQLKIMNLQDVCV